MRVKRRRLILSILVVVAMMLVMATSASAASRLIFTFDSPGLSQPANCYDYHDDASAYLGFLFHYGDVVFCKGYRQNFTSTRVTCTNGLWLLSGTTPGFQAVNLGDSSAVCSTSVATIHGWHRP